ncbi:MAG TPA: acetolactate synthase large subunit [Gammaproteobacteria bacterium]|nr:acetolactate synthase large subunit [Gammaproteobacteria bacterium]
MKVSDLLVRCLEKEGVRYVFGLPGEETEDLMFSLEKSSIRFVPCRHEQGAAFIANIWGRITGKAGVCLSTLGPGATNLITGLADAQLDMAPVVAITAQGGLDRMHNQSHQMLDIVSMFKPIVKWNASIHSERVVTEVVRKAFKLAELQKPGVTHIELPEDVAGLEVEGFEPIAPGKVLRADPDLEAVAQALPILATAKRPLIIAGNGAIREKCSTALTELVNHFHIPVAATFMGKGALSDHNDASLLSIGLSFKDYVLEAVEQADVVVTIGYDIGEYAPQKWNENNDKTIIHIDHVPAEVYTHYRPAVEIVGDLAASIRALHAGLDEREPRYDTNWYAPVRKRILDDIAGYSLDDSATTFTIPAVLNVIRDILDDDGLLISDVGSHKMWIARNFPTYTPNGCIITNGLASMSMALPGGIAASMIDPQRQVVSVMGDGGFMMNSQELETAKRIGAGFTAVILNDNDYGLIRWKQEMSRNDSFGTGISNPDFKLYAESFGIKAYKPRNIGELRTQMTEAITSRELRVVAVDVDASVNTELFQKCIRYWAQKVKKQ